MSPKRRRKPPQASRRGTEFVQLPKVIRSRAWNKPAAIDHRSLRERAIFLVAKCDTKKILNAQRAYPLSVSAIMSVGITLLAFHRKRDNVMTKDIKQNGNAKQHPLVRSRLPNAVEKRGEGTRGACPPRGWWSGFVVVR